jgi:hypothetical protein
MGTGTNGKFRYVVVIAGPVEVLGGGGGGGGGVVLGVVLVAWGVVVAGCGTVVVARGAGRGGGGGTYVSTGAGAGTGGGGGGGGASLGGGGGTGLADGSTLGGGTGLGDGNCELSGGGGGAVVLLLGTVGARLLLVNVKATPPIATIDTSAANPKNSWGSRVPRVRTGSIGSNFGSCISCDGVARLSSGSYGSPV